MKVTITHRNSGIPQKDYKVIDLFLRFLQKQFPLKHDLKIFFLSEREGKMTTGSRNDKDELKILTKGRIYRDILRTLAHEWVHEYQRNVLKWKHGPDIGGRNEDMANSEAGALMKMFERIYPDLVDKMYE
jgi:hypothetical protein